MSIALPGLLLVVACALGWAGFDLLRKLLLRDVPPAALVFLLTIGSAPLFAVWAAQQGIGWPAPGYLAPALASIALNVVAGLLFLEGMRIAPLSATIPLLSLTPVFATLLAIPLLGERPTARNACGILLAVAGAISLHWRTRGSPMKAEDGKEHPGARRGAAMVAVTALFWSLTTPLDKLAVERSSPPLHGFSLSFGVAAGVLLVLAARGRLGDLKAVGKVPGLYVLALVVSTLALGLQLMALPLVWVGTVETLKRGIGNFAAVLSGWFFFREPLTLRKGVSVGVMAVGVGLILT